MLKILLATNNKHKARELSEMLSRVCDCEILTLAEVGYTDEIVEDGKTFEENAKIKARVAASLGYIGIADDSGLCVDALGGEPGVYSARYAGEPCNDGNNNRKLLEKLKDVPSDERTASFVSVIAGSFPDGTEITAKGVCPGVILSEYRGTGGFGYDPLFYYAPLAKTFAEINAEEKNEISHRARAMKKFITLFAKHTEGNG